MKLAALLGLVALEVVVWLLWFYSGAANCEERCSAFDVAVAWAAWIVLPFVILLAIIGTAVSYWLARRGD